MCILSFRSFQSGKQSSRVEREDKTKHVSAVANIRSPDHVPDLLEMENSLIRRQNIPNIPLHYSQRMNTRREKASCGQYPNLRDLDLFQKYWQRFRSSNGTFLLFSAFYDNRELVKKKPTIRILGMVNRYQPNVKTHCQMWFKNMPDAVISRVYDYQHAWFPNWYKDIKYRKTYEPYFLSCKVPRRFEHLVPESVSLVENRCDAAATNVRVINNRSNGRKDFAVCVKSLVIENASQALKLIEWIEIIHQLSGNNKIFMYDLQVHPTMKKIIDFYKEVGVVDVTPYTLPRYFNEKEFSIEKYLRKDVKSKRYNEIIQYNDCFYKNMYRYNYIALLDLNELIVPHGKLNLWWEMVSKLEEITKSRVRDAFVFRNVFFFDEHNKKKSPKPISKDVPKYLYFFNHLYRARNYTQPMFYVKSFFNPDTVLVAHNNWPLVCLRIGDCVNYPVLLKYGQLQHYKQLFLTERKKYDKYLKSGSVPDDRIMKYKKPVINRIKYVVKKLGIST